MHTHGQYGKDVIPLNQQRNGFGTENGVNGACSSELRSSESYITTTHTHYFDYAKDAACFIHPASSLAKCQDNILEGEASTETI